MKFNFIVLSYSVIYAKYNYCYDAVPKDKPTRYFDGKEWKIMKPRHSFRTSAPNPLNIISKEVDWDDVVREMEDIKLEDTIPEEPNYETESTFTTRKSTATIRQCVFKMSTTQGPHIYYTKRLTMPPMMTAVKPRLPQCKLKSKIPTTTKINPVWQTKNIENIYMNDWAKSWTFLITTVKPPVTTKECVVKTTRKGPLTRATKELVTSRKPAKLTGVEGEDENVSMKWSNLMKDFLEFVQLKKCGPYPAACLKRDTTTRGNLYQLGDNRRVMSQEDDLMNMLIDGVQIDDERNEEYYFNSQNTLVPSKETLEDQSQIFDFEPDEGFIDNYIQDFSGDNEDIDLKSNSDYIGDTQKQQDKVALSRRNAAYSKEFEVKNEKKDTKLPSSRSEAAYLNELSDKSMSNSNEIVQSSEIKSYLMALHNKHAKKVNEPKSDEGIKANLVENKTGQSRKEQDKNIRKQINHKHLYDHEDNLLDFAEDTLNTNEVSDYMENQSQRNDKDLEDSDITFDNEVLEDDDVEPNEYSNEHQEVQFGDENPVV